MLPPNRRNPVGGSFYSGNASLLTALSLGISRLSTFRISFRPILGTCRHRPPQSIARRRPGIRNARYILLPGRRPGKQFVLFAAFRRMPV